MVLTGWLDRREREALAHVIEANDSDGRAALPTGGQEFVAPYPDERNHQGLQNALIVGAPATGTIGRIRRRPRLGGLLNYYERAA